MLVTKSRLARDLGASKSTISRACAGPLSAALVGTKINPDHPAAVRWVEAYRLRDRASVLTERTPQPEPSSPAGLPPPPQGPAVFGCAEVALGVIASRWLGADTAAQVEQVLELRDTLILHMFRTGGADPSEFAARLGVPAAELWEVIREGMASEG